MRLFTTFIVGLFLASSAVANVTVNNVTLKLGSGVVSLQVPDKKVRDLIVSELGESIELKFSKDEDPQYIRDFEATRDQARLGFLVQFLGDLIDRKAESFKAKKKSDLSAKEQVTLSAYATLREQVALNWLNEEAKKRNIKTTEIDELSIILGVDLTINVKKQVVAAFFQGLASKTK